MKSNKTKSAMTALVVAAMLCSAAMPIRAAEAQWVNNNGTWSYVKEDGSIAKGWIKDNDCWYAFDDNGAMRTGWIASNEHWYFMGESGVMQADAWVEDNGARYYIKGTGVMAKDYVKDGYELTEDGKAIPLAESKSVVLTDPEAIEGEVIEGNLYVDVTTAKALELKGVTVKGKLVVIGDNQTAGKLTITDSKIESISTQTRNTEVVLSGETEVKTIVLEETAAVTPDKSFKGEVEKIEVQSTTKGEIVIEVPAQEVSTRTYASVDIQAPVESLEVKTDTQIKVNADVKNVVVTESAKDTAIEVSKGSTVGTLTADAPVSIDGKGTVNKVEANVDGVEAGKDTVIKDVETGKDVTEAPKENKPSTGGSSSGGSTGPTYITKTVSNESDLLAALDNTSVDKIIVADDITLTKDTSLTIPENRNVEITINAGVTLTIQAKASEKGTDYSSLIINGTLKLTGNGTLKNDTSYFTVFVNEGGNFTVDGATILSHHTDHNETIKIYGKMTLNSGVIGDAEANKSNSKIYVLGIGVGQNGEFVMNGGTVNASWFGIATNGTESEQTITINGGEINTVGEETNIFYLPKANTVTITGGTFNGNDGGMEMRQGKLVITGGTFTTKASLNNEAADWGSGKSGSFWSTFAFGKPNNDAYSGDLTVDISGATIESNADAILLDTRYSSKAEYIQITISKNTIKGNVKIVEGTSANTWNANSGVYSYTYSSQTTNENEINNADDQNQSDNNNSEDNQIVNNDNLDNNTEDNQVEA